MNPRLRLTLCVVMILLSASYAVLVKQDENMAKVVALGYIAILLTILVVVNLWKHS